VLQRLRLVSRIAWFIRFLIATAGLLSSTSLLAKNIVIGVEDISYFPYFDYTTSETTLSKAILDRFAADNGYTITYVALPIKQFSKWLYENDIDFKYPDNQRWHATENKVHSAEYFSKPIFYLRAGTVVLQENQDKPKSFFKNLGMISGFDPTLWKDEIAKKEVNILADTSPKVLIKHLTNGLVDGVDIDIAVANFYLNNLGLAKQLAYSRVLTQDVFSHQLSTIKYPEIIKQFNLWLAQNSDFIEATQLKFHVPFEQAITPDSD
jgi:polar amino acid transport system substrate-binding protein